MLSRRMSLRLSSRAVGVLMALSPWLAARAVGRRGPSGAGPIDWETFLVELHALTRAQHTDDWDEAAHVAAVRTLMAELDVTDARLQQALDRYTDRSKGFPQIRTVHRADDYSVAVLQFEPGESIALHNHPRMTGVILCLTGSVSIEAFDRLDGVTPDGDLRLRQVADLTLGPGDFATLTPDHGNIHALVATEWCELLDVFTPPYTPDRLEEYAWFARSAAPVEGDDIFAGWEIEA